MQALDLDFPLLSDWNAEATHGFGVAYEHNGMRDVSRRHGGPRVSRLLWLPYRERLYGRLVASPLHGVARTVKRVLVARRVD